MVDVEAPEVEYRRRLKKFDLLQPRFFFLGQEQVYHKKLINIINHFSSSLNIDWLPY